MCIFYGKLRINKLLMLRDNKGRRMPTSTSMEEAALLG